MFMSQVNKELGPSHLSSQLTYLMRSWAKRSAAFHANMTKVILV